MKRLAKILVLLFVLIIAVTCLVACGEKTTIDISSDGYWVIDGVKTEHKAIGENGINGIDGVIPTIEISSDGYWVIGGEKTEHRVTVEDDKSQYFNFYPLDDGTYGISVDSARYLSEIVIPSTYKGKGVTKIVSNAFSSCASLTSITIPDSVTSIKDYAFHQCYSLTNIAIPDSVMSIGSNAFCSCESLNTVTFGENSQLDSIDENTFSYCSSLTSITIPNSVTSIGERAFASCDSLTSITIPNSVTSIGDSAFRNCSSLTIYCEAKSQPSGWPNNWNEFDWGGNYCPVVWGYEE